MEGRSAVWFLLLEVLISGGAQSKPTYFEVGGKLELKPETFSGPIKSITWKLNDNIVGVKDEGQSLVFGSAFRGRAGVDTTAGVLEISGVTKNDSGVFTVTINDNIQTNGYDVSVIKRVPKPNITVTPPTCSSVSKNCTLTCDGDITEAEPVTFYFKKDSGDFKEGERSLTIINDTATQAVGQFFCRMKNPLGQEDSAPFNNPFNRPYTPGEIAGIVVGVLAAFGLVLAAMAGGVVYLKKHKKSSPITELSPSNSGNHPDEKPLNDRSPHP